MWGIYLEVLTLHEAIKKSMNSHQKLKLSRHFHLHQAKKQNSRLVHNRRMEKTRKIGHSSLTMKFLSKNSILEKIYFIKPHQRSIASCLNQSLKVDRSVRMTEILCQLWLLFQVFLQIMDQQASQIGKMHKSSFKKTPMKSFIN